MADPVLGTDVLIQFLKGSGYINYACASEVSIEYSMETKSVKTVGDGVWRRKRGQSLGSVINLSGVIVIDANIVTAFDLLDHFKNMVDIAYKIIFQDHSGGLKVIQGNALPANVNLGGGSEGFGTGEITLECNGDPNYITPVNPSNPGPPNPNVCVAEIETAHVETIIDPVPFSRKYAFVDTMVAGSATISRWDWTFDGGGAQTKFSSGSLPVRILLPVSASVPGAHTVVITPICDNGFSGTPFTLNF
jgi:hypothetical protein